MVWTTIHGRTWLLSISLERSKISNSSVFICSNFSWYLLRSLVRDTKVVYCLFNAGASFANDDEVSETSPENC